ncbi:unnamed protein product [Hyaloperonospora brassicae]|uniref:Uncharacterized protein n=1 Tax=Hyaloperonospora brassicae TaxID=162125 RepID=A0AAV0V1M2_HYABA|nr:unnamed protein product [Hyaloperonospora brassicae]
MSSNLSRQRPPLVVSTGALRPRADVPSKAPALSSGVVLFDPKDLATGAAWRPQMSGAQEEAEQEAEQEKKRAAIAVEAGADRESGGDGEGGKKTAATGATVVDVEAAKQFRLRARVVEEICETEKSYVSDIRALNDHYIVALEEKAHPIMDDAQIAVFFNNLRHLVMLNSKLLADLQAIGDRPLAAAALEKRPSGTKQTTASRHGPKRGASPVSVAVQCEAEGVGAVFCRYAPLFKLYGGYAKDYEEVAALLQNFGRDARLGFSKFLETCREKSGSLKPFDSLLIMPIQRIPRYKLLLERLCEFTPPEHPDAAFLKEAVNRIRSAASLINEIVGRQENLEIVLQAQQKFSGQLSLFTADRRLLKSGKLTKMSTKRQEEVMIHLFNDILLYSGVLITGGYRVRRIKPREKSKLESMKIVTATAPISSRAMDLPTQQPFGFLTMLLNHATFAMRLSVHTIEEGITAAGVERCPCFKVLDLVRQIALQWLSRVVEFRGVLRRRRLNKWSEYYYELRAGVLKQFLLEATPIGAASSGQNGNAKGSESRELATGGDPVNSRTFRRCTDELSVAGAIVIHRSDSRAHKNRFCFQISTTEYDESRSMMGSDTRQCKVSPSRLIRAANRSRSKVSPFRQAANCFGVPRRRDHAIVSESPNTSCETAALMVSPSPVHPAPSSSPSPTPAAIPENEWVLRRLSSLDHGHATDAEISMELAHAAGKDRDAYLLERRRRQILKEIIRSEESYVQCLSECIRLFVQPLLLRQLEGRQMHRRRQSKRRRSLRPVLGGPLSTSARAATPKRDHYRAVSNGSVGARFARRGGSSNSLHTALNASFSVASTSASSSLSATSTLKMLVMDADLSIFFSSVDQIYTLNQQLLDHLSRHLEETSSTSPLPSHLGNGPGQGETANFSGVRVHRTGAIFHAYAPLMQLYTSYASRHSAALSALESPQFAGFLRELPPEADVNRLRRYLNMPVERIPRYKMLLKELLEFTPPEHVDFVPLQSAIHSVDRVASKIEEISEIRENARTLATVSAKLGMNLSGRHFIRDGMLRKVCRSKVQTYYFVLLEDAMVYGRQGGLHKKKFHLLDLWECKVADDTGTMPGVITTVVNSNNAFCFYSPLKSFILLTESEEDKVRWTTDIRDCIDRNLSGKTHPRRTSLRSELLTDNDGDSSSGYELEGGFAIKNGWLNVFDGAVVSSPGDDSARPHAMTSSNSGKKCRRLWITLTLQAISLGSTFKSAQPEETIPIDVCKVAPAKSETCFRLQLPTDAMRAQSTYVFEALSLTERNEWVRALTHCISGGDELALRRRSLKTATLAPIFMFDKVSNVCTICMHTFAVYRPRHHCRLCGSLVCGNCSKRRWTLSYSLSKKASRVCDSCAMSAMSITRTFPAEV